MHLTEHELTAASSAVAALAIIGGYLGVRSANRNAVKIAREERSSRRKDELDALKRATYARYLGALAALAMASTEKDATLHNAKTTGPYRTSFIRQWLTTMQAARAALAEVELVAPDVVRELAQKALLGSYTCTRTDGTPYTRTAGTLGVAMRYDLRGAEIPNAEEMERMGHTVIANLSVPPANAPGPPADLAEHVESDG